VDEFSLASTVPTGTELQAVVLLRPTPATAATLTDK
jgi:hypothetical protein